MLFVLSFNILYYSEKVFLSSGGTHAVVKNSDGFYVVGDVASDAESSHLWKMHKLLTNDLVLLFC